MMPYKFTGKLEQRGNPDYSGELDQETGLYYYGARYYDPQISMWYGVDPMADKYPNVTPYMYTAGNPELVVMDVKRSIGDYYKTEYEKFLELPQSKCLKHIILLTKIDHVGQEELLRKLGEYQKYQDKFEAIIPFSVNKKVGKKALLDEVVKYLPASPAFFDTDIMTTDNIRDIYKELIRESVFENLSDEIPYESDVIIKKVDENQKIEHIYAQIIVNKESQKGMIIGKGGATIKRLGIASRNKIQELLGEQIKISRI